MRLTGIFFCRFFPVILFFLSLALMNNAYILLGSNEGDRMQHLSNALKRIEQKAGSILRRSGIYTTAAWGNTDQPDFLNQVICVTTTLSPQQLLNTLLDIEKELGRLRSGTKWMQRIIDLDILFYNDAVINTADLTIPHPHLQDRKFVLVPLCEIASGWIHPVLKKDIAALTAACKDASDVQILSVIAHVDQDKS